MKLACACVLAESGNSSSKNSCRLTDEQDSEPCGNGLVAQSSDALDEQVCDEFKDLIDVSSQAASAPHPANCARRSSSCCLIRRASSRGLELCLRVLFWNFNSLTADAMDWNCESTKFGCCRCSKRDPASGKIFRTPGKCIISLM